jgi:hypothetical protein
MSRSKFVVCNVGSPKKLFLLNLQLPMSKIISIKRHRLLMLTLLHVTMPVYYGLRIKNILRGNRGSASPKKEKSQKGQTTLEFEAV